MDVSRHMHPWWTSNTMTLCLPFLTTLELMEQLLLWLFFRYDFDMRMFARFPRVVTAAFDRFDPFVPIIIISIVHSRDLLGRGAKCATALWAAT